MHCANCAKAIYSDVGELKHVNDGPVASNGGNIYCGTGYGYRTATLPVADRTMTPEARNIERMAIDPAGYQTADCEHCDGHIMRRVTTLPTADGITDGRWRHVRNGLIWCHQEDAEGTIWSAMAKPRLNPGSEE